MPRENQWRHLSVLVLSGNAWGKDLLLYTGIYIMKIYYLFINSVNAFVVAVNNKASLEQEIEERHLEVGEYAVSERWIAT
jgi:hypothetical protein